MSAITFGSACSGIEAASVAWHAPGWRAAWLAEIEPFPCAVLAHHYPDAPNLGDMTGVAAMVRSGVVAAPDVLVGGTPCQAFSIAGLRNSLDDARGQLSLSFVGLANAIDTARIIRGEPAATIVWENVPGVLSTSDNAFGCFLGALAGEDEPVIPSGKKWTNAGCVFGPQRTVAWRVLDAQYFGVAQRRRRVFVVASARDGFDPTAVLFEFDGLRRDSAPSRETGQDVAGTLASRTGGGGFPGSDEACSGYVQPIHCLAHGQGGAELGINRAPTLTCNHEAPIAAYSVALRGRDGGATAELGGNVAGTLRASGGGGDKAHVLAFDSRQDCVSSPHVFGALGSSSPQAQAACIRDIAGTITSNYGKQLDNSDTSLGPNVAIHGMAVRRLLPVECEKLQGFPRDYTSIPVRKYARKKVTKLRPEELWHQIDGAWWLMSADGPRYKALGNSMCTNVMAFIGRRIDAALRAKAAT